MKTLLLFRHAKSSWADDSLADHDRPLNARGERDAPRMGALGREQGWLPDLILCSTALRARNTARLFIEGALYEGELRYEPSLYLADPDEYIAVLRRVPPAFSRVMVVGHNPGLEQLVERFAGMPQPMPTAALAEVRLPLGRWSELAASTRGELQRVLRPKEVLES